MEAYNFYNVIERLDKADLLYQVLSKFTSSKVNFHPDVVSNDQMGYIFEELIRRFSELSNKTVMSTSPHAKSSSSWSISF